MSPLEILKHLRRRPFQPLRVYISDGSFYDIPHPELAMVSRIEVAIAIEVRDGELPDHMIYCDPIHITRIEPLEEAAAKAGKVGSSS